MERDPSIKMRIDMKGRETKAEHPPPGFMDPKPRFGRPKFLCAGVHSKSSDIQTIRNDL